MSYCLVSALVFHGTPCLTYSNRKLLLNQLAQSGAVSVCWSLNHAADSRGSVGPPGLFQGTYVFVE